VSAAEIVARRLVGRRAIGDDIAADHDDPPAVVADSLGEPIDQRKMSDVLDNGLKFDVVTPATDGGIRELRSRDDGVQRSGEVAYRVRRGVDRVEIRKVAGDRCRPVARRIARCPRILECLCEADDMRAVGNESLHGFESNAAAASGHDHSFAGQIDAGQHLIGG